MSEVQKIRDQIEQDAAILQLLQKGFKTVASHDIINHALDQLGAHHERLGDLIGPEKAIEVVIEAIGKDYLPETLEVEIVGSRDAMKKVFRDHGGDIELGETIRAKFPPGTVIDPTVINGYQSVVFQDLCAILLKKNEEGKHVLLLDWEYVPTH